ncbi:MAG: glycosyltransferase family 4 protein [Candidatus Hydrogenedentes bacterium]|nr:glycosyltransferase family 4 protein [Candidatus Hydrogenedentota bacterium]
MIRVSTLYPVYCSGTAVSHICLSLCEHMRDNACDVRLWTPACDPAGRAPFVHEAWRGIAKSIAYKLDRSSKIIDGWLYRKYLNDMAPGDIAYLWPATPLPVYKELKRRGHTIVVERINCHRATSKRILDNEYTREGWRIAHDVTQEDLEIEREKMALADYLYCPSPLVTQSFLDEGVPTSKILNTSYGWSPGRLQGTSRALEPCDGITVVFVGRIGVRKGAHLLVRYWDRANVKGRLVLAGRIEGGFAQMCGSGWNRPDVTHLGFSADIGAVYRSADVFAFPSLEEGSPLVIYETLAAGLTAVVSPMGAGGIARDGKEGIVLDPYDEEGWVEALRRVARDAELRKRFAESGMARAQEFTWAKVGAKRRELLLKAIS